MAQPTPLLIDALRRTAARLAQPTTKYQWSSFAHCNCGHLAQTVTGFSPRFLQEGAMQREGDWGEQAAAHSQQGNGIPSLPFLPDYGDRPALDEGAWEPENIGACNATGAPLDVVFDRLVAIGLDDDDIRGLERLSDPAVRRRLGTNTQDYPHYKRENVIAYLRAWADLLEAELPAEVGYLAAE